MARRLRTVALSAYDHRRQQVVQIQHSMLADSETGPTDETAQLKMIRPNDLHIRDGHNANLA